VTDVTKGSQQGLGTKTHCIRTGQTGFGSYPIDVLPQFFVA
jgi:hypothetical protein